MKNDDFTFLDKREYLHDLIERISKVKTGDRVMVVTLAFDIEEPLIRKLIDVMCDAARKGVEVSLAVDTYVLLVRRKKTQLGIKRTSPMLTINALKELHKAGGEYAITNRPDRTVNNPFSGRSHIKTAIINDEVYIGGCNLTDATHLDMMIRFKNATVADWLYRLNSRNMSGFRKHALNLQGYRSGN